MFGLVQIIAGLGWEPEIRGLLTVALAMAVLAGSVWLLLVTNTGTRLGSLISLAGFFGWMFVMGIFWWIYGIGWVGSLPTWEVQETYEDIAGAEVEGLREAFTGNVDQLPEGNCFAGRDSFPPEGGVATVSLDPDADAWSLCTPRAIEVLMDYSGKDRESLIQELLNPQSEEAKIPAIAASLFDRYDAIVIEQTQSGEINRTCPGNSDVPEGFAVCASGQPITADELIDQLAPGEHDDVFDELVVRRQEEIAQSVADANERLGVEDFRYLNDEELAASIDETIGNAMLRIDEYSLSQLEALAPQVNESAEQRGILDLNGWNLQSSSQAGEAAATADAFLREDLFPEGDFLVLDAYQQGGKPKREGTGLWDRISHKITSTARITHPTNYTVVNVQRTLEKEVDPAKPPPVPEIDPDEPTLSVVMTRNLGNLRLIPALFTLFNLVLFALTCLVLHWRDLGLREKGLEV